MNHHKDREFFQELAVSSGGGTNDSNELRFARTINPDATVMTYSKFVINESTAEGRVAAHR